MEYRIDVAELHYSSVIVEADSLEDALYKISRQDRHVFDDVLYTGDGEYECRLGPTIAFPWKNINDNFRHIRSMHPVEPKKEQSD